MTRKREVKMGCAESFGGRRKNIYSYKHGNIYIYKWRQKSVKFRYFQQTPYLSHIDGMP